MSVSELLEQIERIRENRPKRGAKVDQDTLEFLQYHFNRAAETMVNVTAEILWALGQDPAELDVPGAFRFLHQHGVLSQHTATRFAALAKRDEGADGIPAGAEPDTIPTPRDTPEIEAFAREILEWLATRKGGPALS